MAGIGMNVGLKALLSAQTALDTIGQNISNANTPGYSRKSVLLSAASPIRIRGQLVGSGVDVDGIVRTVDELLEGRIFTQVSSLARLDARLGAFSEVEALFAEPSEYGVSALLDEFFGAVSDLSASPHEAALRVGVAQSTNALAARIRELHTGVERVNQDLVPQVKNQVERLNELAVRVSDLNLRIAETENAGNTANDLRDKRGLLIKEMSQLANVNVHENDRGAMRVTVGGHLLVGDTRSYAAEVQLDEDGSAHVTIGKSTTPADLRGGSIGGLLQLQRSSLPGLGGQLDQFAHNLILEINRAYSTGLPAGGPFHEVSGTFSVEDVDGDGQVDDELLASLDLPFDVVDGALYVNVTDESDGAVTTHRIDVDAGGMTVGDLLDAFSDIPHVTANLNGAGHLQVRAEGGYAFDFGARLDAAPDDSGTFGGGQASLGSAAGGPFALADGDTLDLLGPSGAFSVTLSAADFADVNAATAEEIAAVVNADAGAMTNGIRAVAVGDRLFLQTEGSGATESFQVAGGAAGAALGWAPGTVVNGHDEIVDVSVSGSFSGAESGSWTFVPNGDGVVGETPGLTVSVLAADGSTLATLAIGDEYVPGTELAVADGVSVSFGHGELSATENDAFALDVVADSDTADVLVAFGVNSLLTGSSAADIALREDLAADPDLIAMSSTGVDGGNSALLAILDAQSKEAEGLNAQTLGEFYGGVVGDVGFEVEAATNAQEVEQFLVETLEQQRDQVSGVNLDEELVNLIQFEQAYAAAAQFIQVVNSVNEELLALI